LEAKVALGKDNLAMISWKSGSDGLKTVELKLEKAVEVVSQLPGGKSEEHGIVDYIRLSCKC
jgi:hypothetical protein